MSERPPLVTAARLDDLANRAWPALETRRIGGWLLRASHGVTRRANSVLPVDDVDDLARAIDEVEDEYRMRGIRPTFQISPASQPRSLVTQLARRGYSEEAETLVLVATTGQVIDACGREGAAFDGFAGEAASSHAVSVRHEPSERWVSLMWDVDGRGGPAELDVMRRILHRSNSRYAELSPEPGAEPGPGPEPGAESGPGPDRDPGTAVAVGRLALVDDWGGLFTIATHPGHRRRGHARRVIGALAREAERSGAECLWLQVLADNVDAVRLYRSVGFEPISGYTFWVAPPERRI
jgi:ribosomal protein S18 acetylase RimI-like enzyme